MNIPINIDNNLGIEYIDPEDILDNYSIDEIKSMENGDLLLGIINSTIHDYIQNKIIFKLIERIVKAILSNLIFFNYK